MAHELFKDHFLNGNFVKIHINGHVIEVDKNLVDSNGKGGILDLLFRQNATKISKDLPIILHGNDERESQLRTYINYLQPTPFFYEQLSLEETTTKVMELMICGVDLVDALDHFGAKEKCGDVVGEMLCIMGEEFVSVITDGDERETWKEYIWSGLEWAFINRGEKLLSNSDLLTFIYQKYDNFDGK
ncbi:Uncharacterized protein QTN25_000103 [Entamoeba marina]